MGIHKEIRVCGVDLTKKLKDALDSMISPIYIKPMTGYILHPSPPFTGKCKTKYSRGKSLNERNYVKIVWKIPTIKENVYDVKNILKKYCTHARYRMDGGVTSCYVTESLKGTEPNQSTTTNQPNSNNQHQQQQQQQQQPLSLKWSRWYLATYISNQSF